MPQAAVPLSVGAGEGNRTLVCSLGSCRSTIELRPRGPTIAKDERARQARRSTLKMLAQLQALRLVIRADALPVELVGTRDHFLVDQPPDDLPML
jgi:hypothetical protein